MFSDSRQLHGECESAATGRDSNLQPATHEAQGGSEKTDRVGNQEQLNITNEVCVCLLSFVRHP